MTKSKRGIGLLLILLLLLGCRVEEVAHARAPKAKRTKQRTFIILARSGTVRSATTRFIAETQADTPAEALSKHRTPRNKDWVLHPDSQTKTYARIENPISFISDAIDNYSAQLGSLYRKHDTKELKFLIQLVEARDIDRETIVYDKKVWAKDAASALKAALKPEQRTWPVVAEGVYRATATSTQDVLKHGRRFIRAAVMYKRAP